MDLGQTTTVLFCNAFLHSFNIKVELEAFYVPPRWPGGPEHPWFFHLRDKQERLKGFTVEKEAEGSIWGRKRIPYKVENISGDKRQIFGTKLRFKIIGPPMRGQHLSLYELRIFFSLPSIPFWSIVPSIWNNYRIQLLWLDGPSGGF